MPPRLVFVPSLGSSTKVPLGHACSSSVTFKIYVTVFREWFTRFRTEGKRIDVWSDLPGGGRRPGEWGDMPFVEQTKSDAEVDSSSSSAEDEVPTPDAISFSLLSPEEQSVQHEVASKAFSSDKKVTLIATFTLPQTYTHYSYTFRIAGPGSRIEWLGSMGSNGTVIVGEPGHRSGFEEQGQGQWSSLGSSARKWERQGFGDELVEIGKFKNVDMVGWSFGKHGASEKVAAAKTTKGANLFLLHPRLDALIASRPFTDPPSSIVISSQDNETALTDDGTLMSSAQSVSIQEFYPFGLPTELSGATDNDWETLDSPDGSSEGFIFAKSSDSSIGGSLLPSSVPVTLAVLPSVSGDTLPPTSTVTLPLPILYHLQPNLPLSILYSPANESIKIVDLASPDVQAIPKLSLIVGRDGGKMMVVPGYEIGAAAEEEKYTEDLWQVGIMDPAITAIAVEHDSMAKAALEPVPQVTEDYLKSSELDGEFITLATPPPNNGSPTLPANTEVTSPVSDAPEVGVAQKDDANVAAPSSTQVTPSPSTALVKIKAQSDHISLVILRVVITAIHVLVGLWAAFILKLHASLEDWHADKGAHYEKENEAVKEKEEEASTEAPAFPDVANPPATDDTNVQPVTPPNNDPAEEEGTIVVESASHHPKSTAPKSILTPPMTPPHSHAVALDNKLSALAADALVAPPHHEEPVPAVTPTYKTKLVFTLPPNTTSLKFILNHANPDTEADVERIRLLLDRRELSLPGDGYQIKTKAIGEGSWFVDVDASEKTGGRVEIAVV